MRLNKLVLHWTQCAPYHLRDNGDLRVTDGCGGGRVGGVTLRWRVGEKAAEAAAAEEEVGEKRRRRRETWQTRETVALFIADFDWLDRWRRRQGGGRGELVRSRKSDRRRVLCRRVRSLLLRLETKAKRAEGHLAKTRPLHRWLWKSFFLIQIPHGWVGCISPHHQPFTERLDLQKMMEFTIMSC